MNKPQFDKLFTHTVVISRCYPRLKDLLAQAGSGGVWQEGGVVHIGLQLLCSWDQGGVEPIHGVR